MLVVKTMHWIAKFNSRHLAVIAMIALAATFISAFFFKDKLLIVVTISKALMVVSGVAAFVSITIEHSRKDRSDH